MSKISKRPRESGIELLKLIAMFMIVISHLTQSYGSFHPELGIDNTYFCDLNIASANINNIIMIIFRHFGSIGNDVFFICSAWFLVDMNKLNKKKIVNIIANVWLISILFLLIFLFFGVNLKTSDIIYSLFPTTFANNWYITAYIILYLIHPALNLIIDKLNQRQMLLVCLIMFVMYSLINSIKAELLFSTSLVVFIMLYFFVAYFKLYCKKYTDDKKFNNILLMISALLLICILLVLDFAGLKINFLYKHTLCFSCNEFPIIILIAFSLFFVFKNKKFVNEFINYWASLTLYVYIIHENILFRSYARPYIFVFIKNHFGYKYLPLWIVAAAVLLFLASSIVSLVYKQTLGRLVAQISNFFYDKIFHPICSKLLDALSGK